MVYQTPAVIFGKDKQGSENCLGDSVPEFSGGQCPRIFQEFSGGQGPRIFQEISEGQCPRIFQEFSGDSIPMLSNILVFLLSSYANMRIVR